MMMMATTTMTT